MRSLSFFPLVLQDLYIRGAHWFLIEVLNSKDVQASEKPHCRGRGALPYQPCRFLPTLWLTAQLIGFDSIFFLASINSLAFWRGTLDLEVCSISPWNAAHAVISSMARAAGLALASPSPHHDSRAGCLLLQERVQRHQYALRRRHLVRR